MRKNEEYIETADGQFTGSNGEREVTKYEVVEIPPLGFGNADAAISLTKKLENGELYVPAVERAAEIIKSGECMVKITEDDDGCIDGRKAEKLLYPDGNLSGKFREVIITNPLEHKRAKVAGGGYLTALVMKQALDPHVDDIDEDLAGVVEHLTHLGVYCGLHTDSHSSGESVGCGANDHFKTILQNLKKYASSKDTNIPDINKAVRGALTLYGSDVAHSSAAEKGANGGIARTLSHRDYFVGSSGLSRFKVIMNGIARTQMVMGGDKPVSVSKHLGGMHNEAFKVVNTVAGETFSQAALLSKLKEDFPHVPEEKLPQAFALDIPRVEDIARAMAVGRPKGALPIAMHVGLGYQFATEATLTDGSLRTMVVSAGS